MTDHDNASRVAAVATLTNPTTRTASASTVQFPAVATVAAVSQEEIAARLDQALSYLDTVKAALQDEPGKYATCVSTLKDFQTGHNDTPTTVERIAVLLRGHPEVIEGYNVFLPDGYRVQSAQGPGGTSVISVVTPQGTKTV